MARQRKKLLLVDGYNVLRSGSRYRVAPEEDYTDDTFNAAREMLVNDVASYAGREWRAVIVFDGARNEFSTGEAACVGGVRIVFSPAGQSADKVIEKLAHDARERQVETLVVTSDATIQDTVFGGGVDRMSADGFSREMPASTRRRRWPRSAPWPAASTPRRWPSSRPCATAARSAPVAGAFPRRLKSTEGVSSNEGSAGSVVFTRLVSLPASLLCVRLARFGAIWRIRSRSRFPGVVL